MSFFDDYEEEEQESFDRRVVGSNIMECLTARGKTYFENVESRAEDLVKSAKSKAAELEKIMKDAEKIKDWDIEETKILRDVYERKVKKGVDLFSELRISYDIIQESLNKLAQDHLDEIAKDVESDPSIEEWKPFDDTDYYASNLGRIGLIKDSIKRDPNIKRLDYRHFTILKQTLTGHYLTVGSIKNERKVHRIIAKVWNPQTPDDEKNKRDFVNHLDECKINNKSDNLKWCTKSENADYGLAPEKQAHEISKEFKPFYILEADAYKITNKKKLQNKKLCEKSFTNTNDALLWLLKHKDFGNILRAKANNKEDYLSVIKGLITHILNTRKNKTIYGICTFKYTDEVD